MKHIPKMLPLAAVILVVTASCNKKKEKELEQQLTESSARLVETTARLRQSDAANDSLRGVISALAAQTKQFQKQQVATSHSPSPVDQSRPSESTIRSALTECIRACGLQYEPGMGPGLGKGEYWRIDRLEIQQVGNYNARLGYWPVRVDVKAARHTRMVDGHWDDWMFENVYDFRIQQDDYGKWVAHKD